MIKQLNSNEIIKLLGTDFGIQNDGQIEKELYVSPEQLINVVKKLKNSKDASFDLLTCISGIDYVEYFQVVYHLTSTVHKHSCVLKVNLYGRSDLVCPSVYDLWQGADFQEREIWDLLGIYFEGHPNMKRIFLWDGFEGHPLRRDYLESPR
ncbi:MAG: NADH-quinone oxidoreductase subunit C [SAR202 cluster bacterium]|nr:NADH-quinone oxidoreductase subunit C [Chloroflexota bacterium]MQG50473.1 NADH-quinone oxidoreductase subunit C [SAR202 cluster bacterium]|tara:strand:- start:17973 stop:18425 length:453 start_codon:yes stop_codon:yes gene_type:complete